MTKRRKCGRYRKPTQIDHIERKIDTIMTRLLMERGRSAQSEDLDQAIRRLNETATMMRQQAEREREAVRRLFGGY